MPARTRGDAWSKRMSLFHRLRIQFLSRFASGQALGDDQAASFDAEFGQSASEPDGSEDASYSSGGNGDGRADAVGQGSAKESSEGSHAHEHHNTGT